MNRKLQHTMTALSGTAAVLGLMLLAGAPTRPAETDFGAYVATAAQDLGAGGAGMADAAEVDADAGTHAVATPSGHARRARNAIALPYFSIARGLRHATGS